MPKGYWFTHMSKVKIPPGTSVHKFKGYYDIGGFSAEKEKVFEAVRKEHYPKQISRVGCTFICPDFKSAMKWIKGDRYIRVFEVSYTGRKFRTDAKYWNNCHYGNIEEMAHLYWQGTRSGGEYPEILVQGNVQVLREMDTYKDGKKRERVERQLSKERSAALLAKEYMRDTWV